MFTFKKEKRGIYVSCRQIHHPLRGPARDTSRQHQIRTNSPPKLRCTSFYPVSTLDSTLSPNMQDDFLDQFSILREEFRLLQGGFRFKNAMEQPLNNGCLGSALLNATERRTDTRSSLALSSSSRSPFKSSEPSHSSTESERAQSEVPTDTFLSGSDDLAAPLRRHYQNITENVDQPLDGSTGNPRSKMGHKKSRQGCFNCKRRKIKVLNTVSVDDLSNYILVSRNSTSM